RSTDGVSPSREATIALGTRFLAPRTRTVPSSGLPPRTSSMFLPDSDLRIRMPTPGDGARTVVEAPSQTIADDGLPTTRRGGPPGPGHAPLAGAAPPRRRVRPSSAVVSRPSLAGSQTFAGRVFGLNAKREDS